MKTLKLLCLCGIASLLLAATQLTAQENARPEYVVLTHTHWNLALDDESASRAEWEALEKEYLEKVIKKNDHIWATSILSHMYTGDNSDAVLVSVYGTWEDIEKAQDKTAELEKAAWPDEAARKAFFQKLERYYVNRHSDEIYSTLEGAKFPMEGVTDSTMVVYMQKVYLAFPQDGTNKEFEEVRMEYAKNVIHKNPHIKAYYPMRHAWGSDNREMVHVFIVESLCDVSEMNQAINGLIEAAWPDEAARDAFFKKYDKYFTGQHGDFLYTSNPGLSK